MKIGIIIVFLMLVLQSKDLKSAEVYHSQQKGAIIVDIRTKDEYNKKHPRGSVWIPAWVMKNEKRVWTDTFVNEVKHLRKKNPKKTIILICKSGNRSKDSVGVMKMNGVKNISHVKHGFETDKHNDDWVDSNLPTD